MINTLIIWSRWFFRLTLVAICWLLVINRDSEVRVVGGSNSTYIDAPLGMVWIPGGKFTMGTGDIHSFPNERPASSGGQVGKVATN